MNPREIEERSRDRGVAWAMPAGGYFFHAVHAEEERYLGDQREAVCGFVPRGKRGRWYPTRRTRELAQERPKAMHDRCLRWLEGGN